jgi:PST family polysaccharide transporter
VQQQGSDGANYRGILRSSSIVAGSSIVNIGIGILRVKGVALLLGPAGVGLVGLLTSVMTSASTLFGLGLANSGVRQLAAAGDDPAVQHRVRIALLMANLVLGIAGGLLLWLFRDTLSVLIFGNVSQARNISWLGLGVFLTLVAGSQTALLQGLRRIEAMVAASVSGALLGTVAGVLAIWLWGEPGVIALVLLLPACLVVASSVAAFRVHRSSERIAITELLPQWQDMATLGIAFMLTALLNEWTQLFVRSIIGNTVSMTATGHFQAAWTVSMQYIGFVLTAMLAEYYPRLAAGISDLDKTNRAVNAQIQIALLLGGPVMIAMIAGAPLLIEVLYSKDFAPSIEILRWQALGDVFKVASWPMGFILLAKAERGWFLLTQSLWNVLYGVMIWYFLPTFGLAITGVAFLVCYAVAFGVNLRVTRKVTGFRCAPSNLRLLLGLLACCASTWWVATAGEWWGLSVGAIIALAFATFALARLVHLSDLGDALPRWTRSALGRLNRLGGPRDPE